MLVAAGWVTIESIDPDYQEHCKLLDPMDYQQWTSCKREWDELNDTYNRDFAPLMTPDSPLLSVEQERDATQLLKQMSHLEWILGY